MNARTAPIVTESFKTFPDASGAPAVLRCGPFIFACDLLGSATLNLIKPVAGSRTESKIAAQRVRAAYAKLVEGATDAAWRVANAALYADASKAVG
jgi:hypothetical protein